MLKNKSYIGISFVILIFGIYAIPKIIGRMENNNVVQGDRLDKVSGSKSVDGKLVTIGPAPKFELINQDNAKISNDFYKGKVYVLEFFFATCPSICPKMNANMVTLQNDFFGNPNFGIASITIDPVHDTPAVLKEHAKLLGVKSSNWNFLTGDKEYIYSLSNKGFNIYVGENSRVQGGFEHSGLFALIDKKGNIRCRKDDYGNPILYYDGLEKKGIRDIQQDIQALLKE
ncbi:SCO family protein [Flavobacterium gilvum]|uniref:SCO family protein n=1 Tax=Flavobacterium gilvum TaxID=1492737 RepID=A0AAC9N541_9FLAO|nr:SCO family protein [Flavobacterium gilvum]AOW09176.1 SCO family protein [Flavobacterium gilvum]KFC59224.1 photosynthetic protein synthase II [Flavobacterium gilvum]